MGVKLRSDLSWSSNTSYLVKKANTKLWSIRRLKNLGANQTDLMDVYTTQVRSILDYAVPV